MNNKRVLSKKEWKDAIGARNKPKRLKLKANELGLFICPVERCDSEGYRSKRGCRKHVYSRHGWFYYFDEKPDVKKVFPSIETRQSRYKLPSRSSTVRMPTFLKTCRIAESFNKWLTSPGGGGKSNTQADQISCKVLKYAKFCCDDVSSSWDLPESVLDYCIGSVSMLSDFVTHLQEQWKVGYSGIVGYMNSIGHIIDYRRSNTTSQEIVCVFVAAEVYLQRVKRYLVKKMKIEWNTLLSVDYLDSINCWATLKDLQKVVPFHSNKYKQIMLNSGSLNASIIAPHDLSFCTSFIVAVLFLLVKASRPMTFQFLTVQMLKSVGENGMIDQTAFKTNVKYGFDTLIFSIDVLTLVNGYIDSLRPRLNPTCDYLLICRSGKQISKLSDVLGRIVFQAIGKYINPTRYRQIVETESWEKLSVEEQASISEDQKHSSRVARVHYQKVNSQNIALKGKTIMDKLRDSTGATESISTINLTCLPTTSSSTSTNSATTNTTEIKEHPKAATGRRNKKVPFSAIEDGFLREGLRKYGGGKWTAIINDPLFSFNPSRKVSTLAVRAKQKGFT